MERISAGKVLLGLFFSLCFGFKAQAQSPQQKDKELNNFNVRSFGQAGVSGNSNSDKKTKSNLFKSHRVYTFKVLYKDGAEKEVTGHIKYVKDDSTYILAYRGGSVKASDTQYIYRVDIASGDTVAGTSYQNQWLFSVIKGKINGYSNYAENSASYITHISRNGSGQLQSLDFGKKHEHDQAVAALTAMVTGNETAEQLIREHKHKAKRKELIKNIALGGLGFTIVGIAAPPLATAFIVGVPVGVGAGVATASVRTVDLLEVIDAYNNTEAIAFF
ncbi:hypothetical protein ACFS7Z_12255 [Pontibacter toksunensis]|uniref:Uncharacterized protein n=1 Tax=Pontibacter toksunensis TaxID=1332631 RepID=A0ABW6BUE8_9BACT